MSYQDEHPLRASVQVSNSSHICLENVYFPQFICLENFVFGRFICLDNFISLSLQLKFNILRITMYYKKIIDSGNRLYLAIAS